MEARGAEACDGGAEGDGRGGGGGVAGGADEYGEDELHAVRVDVGTEVYDVGQAG